MVKSLTAFSHVVLQDLGNRCGVSTERDCKTITTRVEEEGDSFLTITLPAFGKGFQKSLDRGAVGPDLIPGFRFQAGLPRFLGGFLSLIFDCNTGVLLDEPSIEAIRAVHGFTSMFGKVRRPCSDERDRAAFAGYIKCEQEVRFADSARTPEMVSEFSRASAMIFGDMFDALNQKVEKADLLPRHGPGATAERLTANQKWLQDEWTWRLERWFPSLEFLFPSAGWYQDLQRVRFLEPRDERPVRVITVPKTLKTPRIIAIEPAAMMYAQQSLFREITESIQRDDILRSTLGYLDQEPNRHLARQGSLDGSLATLDLSEASDRVSNQLVRAMLAPWPQLAGAVDACRSRKADVPGFGVQRLAKFASMGSALCFPIEAIVFTTLTYMAVAKVLNTRVSRALLKEYVGRVRVYGDDIIVPTHMMSSVIEVLEDFGLRVNKNKSFGTGKFRESCGGDFYAGAPVTPVRMRSDFPSSRTHVDEIAATVAFRNNLFEAGYELAVEWLDRLVGRYLGVYPEITRGTSALGRWVHGPVKAHGHHPSLHRPFVKAYVVKDQTPSDPLGDHGALMKWFLFTEQVNREAVDLPVLQRDHLQRAGRPAARRIKLQKVLLVEE